MFPTLTFYGDYVAHDLELCGTFEGANGNFDHREEDYVSMYPPEEEEEEASVD